MKRFIFLILSIFFLTFTHTASAQETEWIINNFSSEVNIQKSGEVKVTEKLSVDFYDTEKHGIYRDIPYIYRNEDGSKYYTEIKDIKVPGQEYKVTKENDYIRIRIGHPDKTITGAQQYTISYTAVGVLRGFSSFDEFYWNVTGSYWDVPIQAISTRVTIPEGQIQEVTCYVGVPGSTQTCAIQKNGSVANGKSQTIQPGEGVTIAVAYPKGITQLPVIQSFGQRLLSLPSIATFISIFVLGNLAILVLWSQKGRDLWFKGTHLFDENAREEKRPLFHKNNIVVEYSAPDKLRPAEIGVIMDERADTLDVTGTIIDLATRGYLSITEEKKKWVFGSNDYTFTKKEKSTTGLLLYEKELYTRLFDHKKSVKMSDLKMKFYTDLKVVKDQLYEDMVEKGFFPSNPEKVRTMYIVASITSIVCFGTLLFSGLGTENEFLFMGGIAGVVTGVNFLIMSGSMSRRTAKGYEMFRRIKGYRLFIENVEKHRQKFFESKNMFNEVLPYTIVFGLTAKFAKALKDMGYKPDTTTMSWYTGAHLINLSSFESSMSSFSQSLGSAMASAPSSSGSGGGGSSGGGFGGGGGGSW
jgi:uncharacterized membrane protein